MINIYAMHHLQVTGRTRTRSAVLKSMMKALKFACRSASVNMR